METYYAKQISPELQDDDLFYQWRDKDGRYHIGMNDDYIAENIIIDGNKEFHSFTSKEYDKIKQLDSVYYECEYLENERTNHCYWSSWTEFIHAYFSRSNGKKYNTREIHRWKLLIKKYEERWDIDDIMCDALELMTGLKWREISLRGCSQSDWQKGYASENLSDKDVRYVEMCYYNTGEEFIVYESKEDFENEDNGCSYYVEDINDLRDRLQAEVHIYVFDGYVKVPQYKEVE